MPLKTPERVPSAPSTPASFGPPTGATRIVLEPAGRIFLPSFALAAILGWAAGGVGLLFAACGLSVLLIAWLGALRNSRGLELRVLRTAAHAVGQPFFFELEIHSRRRRGVARDLFVASVERSELASSRRSSAERPIGHLAQVAANETARIECGYRHAQRGRRTQLNLVLHSSHPFGLLRIERPYDLPVDFLAWPRLGRLLAADRKRRPSPESGARNLQTNRDEEDFHQLRPWREGMSRRRVHWKLSARRSRPLLQEFTGQSDSTAHVGLLLSARERRGPGRGERHSFQSAVSLTATLLARHLRQGLTVSLGLHGRAPSGEPSQVILTGLRGRTGLVRALDSLALVQPELVTQAQLLRDLQHASEAGGRGTLVFAGADLGARAPDPKPSGLRLLDVDSAEIDSIFERGTAPDQGTFNSSVIEREVST